MEKLSQASYPLKIYGPGFFDDGLTTPRENHEMVEPQYPANYKVANSDYAPNRKREETCESDDQGDSDVDQMMFEENDQYVLGSVVSNNGESPASPFMRKGPLGEVK